MADTTELQLLLTLKDSLSRARTCASGLALKRGDQRWIKVASMMDQLTDKVGVLFNKAQNGGGH